MPKPNKFAQRRPQIKVNQNWIDLTQKDTNVPDYSMSDCVRDALEIADRIWFHYLERVDSGRYWITKNGVQKRSLPVRPVRETITHPDGVTESRATGEMEEFFPPNPFDAPSYRKDPNLWVALQAKGYVLLSQEQILEAADKRFEELAK